MKILEFWGGPSANHLSTRFPLVFKSAYGWKSKTHVLCKVLILLIFHLILLPCSTLPEFTFPLFACRQRFASFHSLIPQPKSMSELTHPLCLKWLSKWWLTYSNDLPCMLMVCCSTYMYIYMYRIHIYIYVPPNKHHLKKYSLSKPSLFFSFWE